MDHESRKYASFTHRECECFPCHAGVEEPDFNCLFCYCPLYLLGKECGGNYQYTEGGIKDCSHCTFPHRKENFDAVLRKLKEMQGGVDR